MNFPKKTMAQLQCCLAELQEKVAVLTATDAATSAPADYTLVAGTAPIVDAAVLSTSKVILTRHTPGGTPGHLSYVVTAGVGVAINSSSNTDTSVVTAIIHY